MRQHDGGGATIVWFRQDLRVSDHEALHAAVHRGKPVIPLFIHSPDEAFDGWPSGGASRWWLHHSIAALDARLRRLGSCLTLRVGRSIDVLEAIIDETGADAVGWSRLSGPGPAARDLAMERALTDRGVDARGFSGQLLFDADRVRTGAGRPYQVFSPFWRALQREPAPETPFRAPRSIPRPRRFPESQGLEALGLLPDSDWAAGFRWHPGEDAARRMMNRFAREGVDDYERARDFPGERGTSRLSPHLRFGEISPRTVWNRLAELGAHAEPLLRQLAWREFAHYLLSHYPHTVDRPLRPAFEAFPWKDSVSLRKAWERGRTGFPIVDAGMRELWTTGWMHNRVRMIVASFLVKDLLVPWQHGARWFFDTLVDADLANNTFGWQWAAGCGADAAPYFRVFNPVLQAKRFDPRGAYVRRWVPELGRLPDRYLHEPAAAPEAVRSDAGVRLGETYPHPIVDHALARDRALIAYDRIRKSSPPLRRSARAPCRGSA